VFVALCSMLAVFQAAVLFMCARRRSYSLLNSFIQHRREERSCNVNMAASMKAAHELQSRTRTDDVLSNDGVDFNSLLLSKPVLEGLSASGFQRPSPIQLKAIPLGRCGLGTRADKTRNNTKTGLNLFFLSLITLIIKLLFDVICSI